MADATEFKGGQKEFKTVGRPNLPGRLSHAIAAGKAKFGTDAVVPAQKPLRTSPSKERGYQRRVN
jgi:hypothetical protein